MTLTRGPVKLERRTGALGQWDPMGKGAHTAWDIGEVADTRNRRPLCKGGTPSPRCPNFSSTSPKYEIHKSMKIKVLNYSYNRYYVFFRNSEN